MALEISKNVGQLLHPTRPAEVEQALQISREVAAYLWQKCMQLVEIATPTVKSFLDREGVKEITQSPTFNSTIEKIKSSVSSISDKPFLLCGLTWISRKIPIVRIVSPIFQISLFCSILHMGQRLDKVNIGTVEENKKFHAGNEQAKELTNKDLIIVEKAAQLIEDLKSDQLFLRGHSEGFSRLVERTSKLWAKKVASKQSPSRIPLSKKRSYAAPSHIASRTSKQVAVC